MLETIYTDAFSDLTFIHNVNKETLLIIDSEFKVYASISYNPFEPSNEDILDAWKKASSDYYAFTGGDDKLYEYRLNMKTRSDEAFAKWLKEDSGYNDEEENEGDNL